MKDHQRAEFTNKLRDTAIKYQGTQQLRSRLAAVVDECIPKDKNIEAERDALRLRVGDLEQAFNYIKSELKEVHTVNCYPPINNYDPVIINVLKVCEVVLKNKLEVSDNE
jgi:hypothetical protein